MMNFTRALIIIGLVIIGHAMGMFFELYWFWPWYDMPMHFGGGLAAGALGLAIWNEGVEDVSFKGWMAKHLKWWLVPLFVLGIVAIISVAWELHEYILDELFAKDFIRQPSIADTMADFTFDTIGGLVAILLFHRFRK
ncbi:MAG: hypothetical protein ABH846_02425 [Patescibacteria group bacterium]